MLSWIQSIACYTIVTSLLMGIVPEGKDKKYVKFFIGLLLSLLLVSPVMELFGVDEAMAQNYENLFSEVWEGQREILEEQEQKQEEACLQAWISKAVESFGCSLDRFQYQKTEEGMLSEMTVWITEGTEEKRFSIPTVLVENISIDSERKREEAKEGETDLEAYLADLCGLDAEHVRVIKQENKTP